MGTRLKESNANTINELQQIMNYAKLQYIIITYSFQRCSNSTDITTDHSARTYAKSPGGRLRSINLELELEFKKSHPFEIN